MSKTKAARTLDLVYEMYLFDYKDKPPIFLGNLKSSFAKLVDISGHLQEFTGQLNHPLAKAAETFCIVDAHVLFFPALFQSSNHRPQEGK